MNRWTVWTGAVLAGAGLSMGWGGRPEPAYSQSSYYTNFSSTYPSSSLANSSQCNVCHVNAGGGGPRNSYGSQWEASDRTFTSINSSDADGDAFSNLTEINAGTFPGNSSSKPNTTPVANAGSDQYKKPGQVVTLDGTGSSDADANPLTYSWSQTGGTTVSLSSTTAGQPTFTPSVADTYTFSLTVNDGTVNSSADAVVITVTYVGPQWYVNDTYVSSTDSFTYVGGSDTSYGLGSPENPLRSAAKALIFAKSGDTIYIDAGLYADTYVLVSSTETAAFKIDTDNLTIIGKDSNATVIDPPGDNSTPGLYGIYADTQANLTVKNIGVTGAYYGIYFQNVDGSALTAESAGANGYAGIHLAGGSDTNTISACRADLNQHGIVLSASSNIGVIQNTLSNIGYQIYVSGGSTSDTINKNNIYVSSANPDSGVFNSSGAAFDFSRNWWDTTDEARIDRMMYDTASAKSIIFRPYRLGVVDPSAGGDTTAPLRPASIGIDTGTAGQIKLTWTIPTVNEETNGGSVGYAGARIYRLANTPDTNHWANPLNLVRIASSTETSWADTTVTGGNVYYYRLTSIDAAAFVNQSFFSDTVAGLVDTTAGQVSLSAPASGHETTQTSIVVQFSALVDSAGIDSYVVEVSKTVAFGSLFFSDTIDGAITADTITGLYNDTHYWRVRAIDLAGNAGAYSDTRGFVVDTASAQVSASAPADAHETTNTSVGVSWSAVGDSVGIDSYALEAAKTSAFASLVFADTIDGAITMDTVTGLYNDTYVWHVRAVDDLGNVGANSSARGFVVDTAAAQVSASAPADGHETTNAPLAVIWSAAGDSVGVDSYAIEAAKTSAFVSLVFADTIDGAITADTITGVYNDTYYWRVRAIDDLGNVGTNSTTRGFVTDTRVDTVQLATPADGSVTADTTPTFSWTQIADSVGIDSYAIEASASPAFATVAYADTVDGSQSSVTVGATAWIKSDTYYWRVRAIDDLANVGPHEDSNVLRIDTLVITVSLAAPPDGHETNAAAFWFRWDGVNAETYAWQLSKSAGFTAISDSVTDTTTSTLYRAFTQQDSFFWRVIGRNSKGEMDTTPARGFVMDTLAAQVALSAPADGYETSASAPAVFWSAVTDSVGIDSYVVEASKSAAFTTTVFVDTTDGTNTTDTITGLYNDTYFWRVRAVDELGNAGASSSARGFLLDTGVAQVSASAPADAHETTNTSVAVSWSAVGDSVGIDSYVVEAAKTGGFAVLVFTDTTDGAVASDTITGLYNDTHFWRVRAIDDLGNAGANSTARGFLVDTAVGQVGALAPADGHETTNTSVLVSVSSLSDSVGIDSYVFEVSKVSAFTAILWTDTIDGALTGDTLTGLYNDTYFWRARAIDDLGNVGANSTARGFVVDTAVAAVVLSSPSSGVRTADTTPALSWSAVSDSTGIDSYAVEVSGSPLFASISYAATVDGSQTSATTDALADSIYYWRVRAIDDLGNAGAHSDSLSFVIDSGVKVTLANPAAGHETTAVSVRFEWSSPDAETYTLHLSRSSAFSSISDSVTDTSATAVVRTLAANDSYYLRVVGRDRTGNTDTASAGFVIDTTAGQVSLVSPADGHETSNTAISFKLEALSDSVGIDSYVIELSKSSAFDTIVFADTMDGAQTEDTITGLYNDTYYWRARAIDDLGNLGANSTSRKFRVDTSAPAAGPVSKMALSNNHQIGDRSTALSKCFSVTLTDDTGNAVKGETVTFSVLYPSAGGAALARGTVVSDDSGQACDTLTLGTVRGPYHVKAASASNSKLAAVFVSYVDGLDISPSTFKMIAPDKSLSASGVAALIQDDLPKSTVVEWNQDAGASAGLNDYVTPSSVVRGRSYWIYDASGGALGFQGTAGFDTVSVFLKAGWHQIGSGQYFYVSWDSDVRFDSGGTKYTPAQADSAGLIQNAVYWYTGGGYAWGPDRATPAISAVQLKPAIGFFIYAKQSCTMTVYPNPAVPAETSTQIMSQAPVYPPGIWAVRLSASAGPYSDAQNYVGVKSTGDESLRSSIFDPPPAAGPSLSLGIIDDASGDGARRAASFAAPITSIKTWTIVVTTNLDSPVTVTWEGVSSIPPRYDAYLIGAPAGPVNLREASSVVSQSKMTLAVGLPASVSPYLAPALDPAQTYAYPNPGPDANHVIYFKHNILTASVRIKIFDLGGRLIRELTGTGSPIPWDGTNRAGQRIGSGVYVYVIESSGARLVDKVGIVR